MTTAAIAERIRLFKEGAGAQTVRETDAFVAANSGTSDGAAAIEDAFYRDLDFGTGGLRGLMGPGTNRMNEVTVAKATQGLVNYIRLATGGTGGSVAIAHDPRHLSPEFARVAACVIAGNGMTAHLFPQLRPTPELSFAVRHLGATAGIVITASHNPKEYNGYKVCWSDGAQVVSPHDSGIIAEVRKVTTAGQVRRADYDAAVKSGAINILGPEVDAAYLAALDAVRMRPGLSSARGGELDIVYTPLHGTGITMVTAALERWGFTRVRVVPEQAAPDGSFPTAKSPNPEERAALEMGIALAVREGADVVFATDPDADRIGIAVRHGGEYRLMTGNQVGALLAAYICETLREEGRLPANGVLIKTIVTTGLIGAIAREFGVALDDCLTGFKYIAGLIRDYEEAAAAGKPTKAFLMGCEESYGYLVGTHARDKDAVVAACVLAEMALWAKTDGRTLVDLLHGLFAKHGVFVESQLSKTMPGKAGMEAIGQADGFAAPDAARPRSPGSAWRRWWTSRTTPNWTWLRANARRARACRRAMC